MKNFFLILFSFGAIMTASWLEHSKITAYLFNRGKNKNAAVMEWKASGMTLQYGPAIGKDGRIYCGGENYFYCFSPDGKLVWKYYSGNLFEAHPVIGKDGGIYSVSPNTIMRFSPEGKPEWTIDAPMTDAYCTEPLVTEWGLILTRQNGGLRRNNFKDFKIVVVDPKGYEKEFISFGDKIKSAGLKKLELVAELDSLLLIRHHTHLMLVSDKGNIVWDRPIPENTTRIAVDASKKYVALSAKDELNVYKIGGGLLWQKIFPGDFVTDILIQDNTLVVNIDKLKVNAFDLVTGEDGWKVSPDAFSYRLATVFEGRMLADANGDILMFNNNGHMAKIVDGKLKGQWEANDNPVSESSVLSQEGVIYALDDQKNLCAFNASPEKK